MTDKIAFTSNGESHELPIDSSKTLRPSNVSPDMKLTVTGSFNPPPLIVFNSGKEPAMTIHADGKITLGENAQPTEAAAACIEAMSHMIQDMIKNAVSRQSKTVTFTVVSAADGNPMHTFKIDPTKKTIVRPLHSMLGYVFEPEEEQSK